MAGLGEDKPLCSCHCESHPSVSDPSLCSSSIPCGRTSLLQPTRPSALDPALRTSSVLLWLLPLAPDPSHCLGSVLPPGSILPWIRPPPSVQPQPSAVSLPTPPSPGGQGLSPSLPPSHPTVPAPASHAHSELGQFSCTSGSSTSRPDSPRPWGVGCRRGVPCWKGVLVHSHRPIDAEHPGGAPSLPSPSPFSPHRSPGGAAKAQGKRGQARRE